MGRTESTGYSMSAADMRRFASPSSPTREALIRQDRAFRAKPAADFAQPAALDVRQTLEVDDATGRAVAAVVTWKGQNGSTGEFRAKVRPSPVVGTFARTVAGVRELWTAEEVEADHAEATAEAVARAARAAELVRKGSATAPDYDRPVAPRAAPSDAPAPARRGRPRKVPAATAPAPAPSVDAGEVAALRAELDAARAEVNAANARADDAIRRALADNADNAARVARLEADLDAAYAAPRAPSDTQEIEALRAEVDRLAAAAVDAGGRLADAHAALDALRADLDAAHAEADALRAALADARAQSAAAALTVDALRADLDDARTAADTDAADCALARSQVDTLRAALLAADAQIEWLRAEVEVDAPPAPVPSAHAPLATVPAPVSHLPADRRPIRHVGSAHRPARLDLSTVRRVAAAQAALWIARPGDPRLALDCDRRAEPTSAPAWTHRAHASAAAGWTR